jgi:hypothetical protein
MPVRPEAGARPQIPEVEAPPKPAKDTRPTAMDEKPNFVFILADDHRIAIACRKKMTMKLGNGGGWSTDLAWGLLLIVLNVVFHAISLGLINKSVASRLSGSLQHWHHVLLSVCVVGGTALSTAVLHAIEVSSWAAAYQLLGALPDRQSAMLYSMNAMTSYGHVNLYLAPRWQMMGSLEALNGWILFGLTTAFLFAIVQKAWSHSGRVER